MANLRCWIAGKRAFHNDRSGKLEAGPARWLPAILACVGTQPPQVCTPETMEQTGSWPPSRVPPPPSPPSSCARGWTTRRARPSSKLPGSAPACGPRPERRGSVDRLTVEEELRFLDQAYAQDGRTGLMLQTLLETGARASELVQLGSRMSASPSA